MERQQQTWKLLVIRQGCLKQCCRNQMKLSTTVSFMPDFMGEFLCNPKESVTLLPYYRWYEEIFKKIARSDQMKKRHIYFLRKLIRKNIVIMFYQKNSKYYVWWNLKIHFFACPLTKTYLLSNFFTMYVKVYECGGGGGGGGWLSQLKKAFHKGF